MTEPGCELCGGAGGAELWRDDRLRVVAVDDPQYPGFTRVVNNAHVRELSDLAPAELAHCLRVLVVVERALRAVLQPEKINIASLGNVVPHLHWHVIPRFCDDAHFPNPIWGERRRSPDRTALARRRAALPALHAAIRDALR